jgi:hypothetical protein
MVRNSRHNASRKNTKIRIDDIGSVLKDCCYIQPRYRPQEGEQPEGKSHPDVSHDPLGLVVAADVYTICGKCSKGKYLLLCRPLIGPQNVEMESGNFVPLGRVALAVAGLRRAL